jgi:hypothetical protein
MPVISEAGPPNQFRNPDGALYDPGSGSRMSLHGAWEEKIDEMAKITIAFRRSPIN